MPDEIGTETSRSDVTERGRESLRRCGGRRARCGCRRAGRQQVRPNRTRQGYDDAGEQAASPEELKVVVSIKGGRATIGVQRPSSDPHIESFDDHDLSGLAQEVPAVIERARARWEEAPKHPAYERPAPPARRRNRRGQGPTQASTAEGEAAEAQQQTLRLF